MNIAFLMMLSAVPGGGCTVHKAVVVQQQAVVAVTPVVPVVVPLYSFSYLPPVYQQPVYQQPIYQQPVQQQVVHQQVQQPQQQVQAVQDEPCDLCQELRKLRLEVARIRGVEVLPQPVQPIVPQPPLTGAAVITQKCLTCHGAAVAATKGGGFVLAGLDGKISPLSLAEKRRILDLVSRDKMPKHPNQPLTVEEKSALKLFLEGG